MSPHLKQHREKKNKNTTSKGSKLAANYKAGRTDTKRQRARNKEEENQRSNTRNEKIKPVQEQSVQHSKKRGKENIEEKAQKKEK
jgi:hypothetical protein